MSMIDVDVDVDVQVYSPSMMIHGLPGPLLDRCFPERRSSGLMEAWSNGEWFVEANDWAAVEERLVLAETIDLDACLKHPHLRLSAMSDNADGSLATRHGLTATEGRRLYEQGFTVQVLDPHIPALDRLAAQAASEVGVPLGSVLCRLVFSPPDARVAYGWHFDGFDNVLIPLRGSKQWQLAPCSELRHPLAGGHPEARGDPRRDTYLSFPQYSLYDYYPEPPWDDTVFESATSVRLEPGMSLFVPRGTWHRTGSVGPEGSIAGLFEFRPVPWLHVMQVALLASTLPDADWRRSALGLLRPCPDSPAIRHSADEWIEGLIQRLQALGGQGVLDLYRRGLSGGDGDHGSVRVAADAEVVLVADAHPRPLLRIAVADEETELSYPVALLPVCDWILRTAGRPFTVTELCAATASLAHKRGIDPARQITATKKLVEAMLDGGLLRQA